MSLLRLTTLSRLGCLAALTVAPVLSPASVLHAQDMFGASVQVVDGTLLVSKPLVGVGAAAVYVFERSGTQWTLKEKLSAPGGSRRGEGFSTSMAWSGSQLAVASGDPEMRMAAHVFEVAAGGWESRGAAPLDPSAPLAPSGGPPEVTMATVMGILQPPQRIVSADGDRVAVSVTGSPSAAPPPVRVLFRDRSGWTLTAELRPEEVVATSRFGASLELVSERLAVGGPGENGNGAVWVFEERGNAWELAAKLQPAEPLQGGRFGTSIAFLSDRLFVGAPGTPTEPGSVRVYTRSPDGMWTEGPTLQAPAPEPGDEFGATLDATASELFVGAPGAQGNRGGVAVFDVGDLVGAGARWLPNSGTEPGFRWGTALSAGDGVVVVGAPLARGATGAAAAFVRDAQGQWAGPMWLSSGEGLEVVSGGQIDCSDEGQAAGFDCSEVDLMSFLPLAAIGAEPGERVSDIWGWTDPDTDREYTLVGRTAGMAVVDVTDAANPRFMGLVSANPSGARDIKVYQDHAFFTGDGAGEHGLVVFDLRRLRDARDLPTEWEADARYTGIASAHNLVLDPEAGFAYPVGASGGGETCGGGLHMVDVRDPKNPTFAGCFTDTAGLIWQGRTHDAQCAVYRGPDAEYRGHEICFVSNETALRIVDVTDKTAPVPLGSASYPGVAYIHQGWLTEDHSYFFLNDELDELVGTTERTRTLIWDVTELDDPVLVSDYMGPNGATDHNLYIKGDRMYQANYQAGFRVLDISDPESPVEVGFFDTTPYDGDPPGFVGAWTAFPYFESGTVVVSSMNEGLFLLKPRRRELIP